MGSLFLFKELVIIIGAFPLSLLKERRRCGFNQGAAVLPGASMKSRAKPVILWNIHYGFHVVCIFMLVEILPIHWAQRMWNLTSQKEQGEVEAGSALAGCGMSVVQQAVILLIVNSAAGKASHDILLIAEGNGKLAALKPRDLI